MQKNGSFASSEQVGNPVVRWLVLAGVVGPPLFVAVFTLAGFLRPGYSPIHQAVSDLGVGSNAWLLDGGVIINGLLLIGFAVGFALSMRPMLSLWLRAYSSLGQHAPGGRARPPTRIARESRSNSCCCMQKEGC